MLLAQSVLKYQLLALYQLESEVPHQTYMLLVNVTDLDMVTLFTSVPLTVRVCCPGVVGRGMVAPLPAQDVVDVAPPSME